MRSRDRGPRVVLLVPLALFVHQVEEWFGGFPAWTAEVLGGGVEPERFLWINAIGLALFTLGSVVAWRSRPAEWIGVVLAALVGLNGLLHALATLAFGRYAPGVVTGLVLSLPLSVVVLRAEWVRLSRARFVAAVVAGVFLHGLVTLVALIRAPVP